MKPDQMFQQAFGSKMLQSSIVAEFRDSFALGSDTNLLDAQDRAIYEDGSKRFEAQFRNTEKRTCGQAFRETFNAMSPRLDTKGKVHEEAGGCFLKRDEQAFFGAYGVLPPITLDSVPSAMLENVDRVCAGLVTHPNGGLDGISATPAWIFDRDLLNLVTHPEIVERVASLIGDEITFLGSDGPMFLPPDSKKQTAWHAFDAEHFGGGSDDGNLQLVSVWVALADASVANGCMKIAPGSFRAFNALNEVAPKFYGEDTKELVRLFANHADRIEPAVASQILARRLNDKRTPALMRLGSTKDSPEGYRYNPFHSAVDRAWCLGERELTVLDECPKVALEAKRGQAFFFTSQNAHASFRNTTNGWRKAIAFRYVKTGAKATKSVITHTTLRLRGYLDLFPGAADLLDAVHRPVPCFEDAAPRLCVRGRIPAGQEQYYFDAKRLEEELTKRGGSVLHRVNPLPTAAT